ncbi:hypothetical protein [Gordonia hydrophobica]|uniref:Uncharacterized protein n=1 Tax=Gordonia hydrophobica TaxID=40516 RepID=A0ABZ2U4Z2_9ACTN|nr:hypothetical protein [Gordonia hydrophobica]MBM7368627.1 putative membrane protein [Gordonia hydrophobica]
MAESTSTRPSKLVTIAGAGLAATGLAHFVAPDLFRGITAPAFPTNTDQALQVNGAIETAVGTAIAVPRTRRAGMIGLGVYGAYLAANMAKAQLS